MAEKRLQINYRVTPDEYAEIARKAAAVELSPSMYARKAAVEGKVKAPNIDRDAAREIVPQLAKIGANVNQIARRVNGGDTVTAADFEGLKAQFEALWDYLLDGKKPKFFIKEEKEKKSADADARPAEPEEPQETEKQQNVAQHEEDLYSWEWKTFFDK